MFEYHYHREVSASIDVNALHNWSSPPERRDYLRHPHMHTFHISMSVPVTHNDRQIELHDLRDELTDTVRHLAANPDADVLDFGGMSCEDIAQKILDRHVLASMVSVHEDPSVGVMLSRHWDNEA